MCCGLAVRCGVAVFAALRRLGCGSALRVGARALCGWCVVLFGKRFAAWCLRPLVCGWTRCGRGWGCSLAVVAGAWLVEGAGCMAGRWGFGVCPATPGCAGCGGGLAVRVLLVGSAVLPPCRRLLVWLAMSLGFVGPGAAGLGRITCAALLSCLRSGVAGKCTGGITAGWWGARAKTEVLVSWLCLWVPSVRRFSCKSGGGGGAG